MKAEDLMIGDWVHLINTTHNVSFQENGVIQDEGYTTIRTPIKMTTVSENCVSYYSNKLEIYITVSSEEIEPILLTPEILEKNGFNDTSFEANKKHKYIIHTDEYQLGYYPNTNSFNVYKKGIDPFYDKNKFCCGFQNIVKYVHELQHVLKLCGIDKEIVV